MRLYKMPQTPGYNAVRVRCVGADHAAMDAERRWHQGQWFTLAEGWAGLDGEPFVDYYCDACVARARKEQPHAN